ncbi:TetR family transcriptional regulator [Nocardioides albertanoniae]|uniref:TetR family transcriptional regulator n=1 Tax=Nocardioides albertanoniae TaxID=1175486 RepID=A0A543AAT2_9ACTN|nr:TetR/AcrR family transcriptional regulator [Nocardioides albertanoniae]TQL69711.1 TetR family transcriptional regulator [Nocardioides albertanoniae]
MSDVPDQQDLSDPSLRLLWRHRSAAKEEPTARRGPKQKVSLDEVVDAAIALADDQGLAAVTMRATAQQVGLGAMTLYSYVPNRDALLVLMVDQVVGRTELPKLPESPRERLALVAELQVAELRAHPWLLDVHDVRPWLGPNMSDRYEWHLHAVDGLGLSDLEMDQTVAVLVGFAASIARSEHVKRLAERATGMTESQWWEANYETLNEVMAGSDYPLAGRVGAAAGEAYQAASDPASELDYGLARIIDGVLAHARP